MRQYWTEEEHDLLRKLYPQYLAGKLTPQELMAAFQGRTFTSIQNKACLLKMTSTAITTINLDALSNVNKRLNLDIDMKAYKKYMNGGVLSKRPAVE